MLPMSGELLNSTGVEPTSSQESLPNDMCYAFSAMTSLPLLDYSAARSYGLDGRYAREDK